MMVKFGNRRAIRSSVVTRMRSELTSAAIADWFDYDSGVKQDNHSILFGALVNGPVSAIIVRILRLRHFTETAEAGVVETVNRVEGIGRVKLNLTQADEPMGMALHKTDD